MTTRKNDPDYYLDWACRITEEVCLRSNRRLSPEGIEAFKQHYSLGARKLAERPAIFRKDSAEMHFWLAEAAQLMVKSAEYSGSTVIGPIHVQAATGALLHMKELTGRGTYLCDREDHNTGGPPPNTAT